VRDRVTRIALVLVAALGAIAVLIWFSRGALAVSQGYPPRMPFPPVPDDYISAPILDTSTDALETHVGVKPSPDNAPDALVGPPLCRLGMDLASRPLEDYPETDLAKLRAQWYFKWGTLMNPPSPNGMTLAQSVWVKQWKWDNGLVAWSENAPYAEPYTFTVAPSYSMIKAIATANPGSLWLVGNEIERPDWGDAPGQGQNEILPEVYAWAYHEVYTAIKEADPTAQVANGSVVVPTPLRIEYLTRVWDEYRRRYGVSMPVDVWHIHVHLGPEKRDHSGIEIPVGLDADVGMFYYGPGDIRNKLVNKDFSQVPDRLRAFRAWMKERGQQNKPLIISEFGVTMPDWVEPGEFTPEKIRDEFLYPGLDFMLGETDTDLGYPADDYRLVQSVWWWSLDADFGWYDGGEFFQGFNGNLFWSGLNDGFHAPHPMGITTLGNYFIDYVSPLAATVNLRPTLLMADPPPFSPQGDPVTVTLRVRLGNSGNVSVTQSFDVTLYEVIEESLTLQIGSFNVDDLPGCGGVAEALVTWPGVAPGVHDVKVIVDSSGQIPESGEGDNELTARIVVGTSQINLPTVQR
jgi:hypothetical protein